MKKKFLSFILAICLIIPCAFMMTACGDNPPPEKPAVYAWGKTFTYQGKYMTTYAIGSTARTLLQQEYNESNLDLENVVLYYTAGEKDERYETVDLSQSASFDELVAYINQNVESVLETLYGDWSINVGNKEENCITINGEQHQLSQEAVDGFSFSTGCYGVKNNSQDPYAPKYIASFYEKLPNELIGDCMSNQDIINFTMFTSQAIEVRVYTKTYTEADGYCFDADKQESYLPITIAPLYSIVK